VLRSHADAEPRATPRRPTRDTLAELEQRLFIENLKKMFLKCGAGSSRCPQPTGPSGVCDVSASRLSGKVILGAMESSP
jgi:hypothetical protein